MYLKDKHKKYVPIAIAAVLAVGFAGTNIVNKINKEHINTLTADFNTYINDESVSTKDIKIQAYNKTSFIATASTVIRNDGLTVSSPKTIDAKISALDMQYNEETEITTEEITTDPDIKLTKVGKYKEKIKSMALLDLSDTDLEYLKIYKKADKKSKVKGYLADGSSLQIMEHGDKWLKIKSGKITGYIKNKYIVKKKKKIEEILLQDEAVTAYVKKDSVYILAKANKDSTSVAIGYKEAEYPILDFSENEKYAFVKRTESISGWIPVSAIKINVAAPTAMTKEEFEDYKIELEIKEQEMLDQYLNVALSSTGDSLTDAIISLISHNESGNFKAARNPKTSGEKTITVGAWQWYGQNAHNILKQICSADPDTAIDIMEGAFSGRKAHKKAKELYDDIVGGSNWESDKRIFSTTELIAIQELLGSDQGVSIQNSKIQSDIQAKVSVAINTYSLSNDAIVAYFCDLFWQNPNNARKVMNECIDHFESAKKLCKADNGLKYLHKTAMKSNVFGKYSKRREYTYSYCKSLIND